MSKEKPFSQVIAEKSTEVLMELRGQHAAEFEEHPKNKSLGDAIELIDSEIRRRPDAPRFLKVRAVQKIRCDGKRFAQDETGEITESQFAALARFFEKVD